MVFQITLNLHFLFITTEKYILEQKMVFMDVNRELLISLLLELITSTTSIIGTAIQHMTAGALNSLLSGMDIFSAKQTEVTIIQQTHIRIQVIAYGVIT